MALQEFVVETVNFQRIISHSLVNTDFIPSKGSEIFAKNLPRRVSDADLIDYFKTAGNIYKIRIMMDQSLTENRGYCYVTYLDPATAKNAVFKLKNKLFKNMSFLTLENSLDNCRIFLGGIPTNKTKEQVWYELIKYGAKDIIDLIFYRGYSDRAKNRGFVFVEFRTHESAARFRAKFTDKLSLWGCPVVIDWSVPLPSVDERILQQVKIIYLRNLPVLQSPKELELLTYRFVDKRNVEKVYKFKDYAFIHLTTRRVAEYLMWCLNGFFRNDVVEIEWAKPSTRWTTQEYRHFKVSMTRSRQRFRTASVMSEDMFNASLIPLERFTPSPECVRERNNLEFTKKRCIPTPFRFQDPFQNFGRRFPNDNFVQNIFIPQPTFVFAGRENAFNRNFGNVGLLNSNVFNASSSWFNPRATNFGTYQIFNYQIPRLTLEITERQVRQPFMDNRIVMMDAEADHFLHSDPLPQSRCNEKKKQRSEGH